MKERIRKWWDNEQPDDDLDIAFAIVCLSVAAAVGWYLGVLT